jgi:hypothetical protein
MKYCLPALAFEPEAQTGVAHQSLLQVKPLQPTN